MNEFKDVKIGSVFTNQGRFYIKENEKQARENESSIMVNFKFNSPVNEGW